MTATLAPEVDLILIHRAGTTPPPSVLGGIAAQGGVCLAVHRVAGVRRAADPNRWATIARARNEGKRLGSAPWLMFLDDDVILPPGSIARLVAGLDRRPDHAALACDYLDEAAPSRPRGVAAEHVGMGATLFRRAAFPLFHFRWEPGRCECQCCCDDLRRLGLRIDYLPGVRADHRPSLTTEEAGETGGPRAGRVLAAFDRHHLARFRGRFLTSLRGAGNFEVVTAVTYGLRPSEVRMLAAEPGVEVVALAANRVVPAIRRLHDFQGVLRAWPASTPVAYWDAGDVSFQAGLADLWALVGANPKRLLAVREPVGYPENQAIPNWTMTIADPAARVRACALLSTNPFLNSGFAAGTAGTMLRYFEAADQLRRSSALRGTRDWGDQTALNLYCHADPTRWREIPESWNYCLFQRRRGDYGFRPDGGIAAATGTPIRAVHGNGSSFRPHHLLFSS